MTIDTINQHIHTYAQKLPAAQIATQLNEAVKKHDAVVVTAPPGAGKSTLLPLTLLQVLPPEVGCSKSIKKIRTKLASFLAH